MRAFCDILDAVAQRTPGDMWHDEIGNHLVLGNPLIAKVVNRQNMRVFQCRGCSGLAFKVL